MPALVALIILLSSRIIPLQKTPEEPHMVSDNFYASESHTMGRFHAIGVTFLTLGMFTFPEPVIRHLFPSSVSPLSSSTHFANSTTPYPVACAKRGHAGRIKTSPHHARTTKPLRLTQSALINPTEGQHHVKSNGESNACRSGQDVPKQKLLPVLWHVFLQVRSCEI